MADYDDTNRGAMFFESDKESDRHPDYKGTINVDGKDYWLSAWDKVSKNGKNYISISVKLKESRIEQSGYEKAKAVASSLKKDVTDTDTINLDDIPFN